MEAAGKIQSIPSQGIQCNIISCICMTYHTHGRVVTQHVRQTRSSRIGSIGNDHHTGMNTISHAYAATMVQTHPTGAACRIDQCIQYGPIGHCITAIEHGFCFAVRRCHRSGIEMVSSDNNRRFHFPRAHQFIECQSGFLALTLPQPANARGQSLESDPLPGHLHPALQAFIFGE